MKVVVTMEFETDPAYVITPESVVEAFEYAIVGDRLLEQALKPVHLAVTTGDGRGAMHKFNKEGS